MKWLKENYPIIIVLIIYLILHIFAILELGFNYNINSDDLSYINSGIYFAKTGIITMHGVISAQIMPGLPILIGIVSKIFGTNHIFLVSLKILWMIMGMLTIYVVYKTVRLYGNKYISAISSLFFLSANYIWLNNLILSETPFILLFSLLVYHSLKLAKFKNSKDYICIVIYYILALFIRPNIAIYPVFLIPYLLINKYDKKLLLKQLISALLIFILVISPWIYRNYKLYDKTIVFTYGIGNPLLLGTYQGVGYPSDSELDYEKNIKVSKEMKYYLDNPNEEPYLTKYYQLEYDKLKAIYRMETWWEKDKASMLKSYLFIKPKENIYSLFYWKEILGINENKIINLLRIELILFIISFIIILIWRINIKDLVFLLAIYFSQVLLFSITFAYGRYAISIFFIRYIIIGIGLSTLYNLLKRNDYSMKENIKKIYIGSKEDYFKEIRRDLKNNQKKFIVTVNPETLHICKKDNLLKEILDDDNVSFVPDGISVVKAGKWLNIPIKERITGVDITNYLLEIANQKKYSMYLFGAKEEVIKRLVNRINGEYSNINLLGYSSGYVKDRDEVMKNIIKLKPDIVIVALGIPYQEKIIYKYLDKFDKGIFIGVGGSLDVLSGCKKRAPKIFIKLNLEWLYRIIIEPKRLKRFWNNNIKFILEVWKEKINND